MPINEELANRIRETFADLPDVEEKKMFNGMCFMVNGKMCVCVGKEEMMCRISPDEYEAALEKSGCREMIHNGKSMKGYIFVSPEAYKNQKDFDHWINLCLDYNKIAKASKPKRSK